MAFHDACGNALHLVGLSDVADFVLPAELVGERSQLFLSTGEQDRVPAASRERARDGGTDAARRPGDDCYAV
jgi:hypothetical protein